MSRVGDEAAPELLRLFVAFELGAAARAAAVAALRALRERPGGDRVRWTREEDLHVTLRFLGATPRARLPELAAALAAGAARVARFEVALAELQFFPSQQRPRVVAVGLAPEAPVAALAASLEQAAVACGHAPEQRRFRAHLTLGRLRIPGRSRLSLSGAQPAPLRIAVERAVLFQSELRAEGARYEALQHFPLGAVPGVRVHP